MTKNFDSIAGYSKLKEILMQLRRMLLELDTYMQSGVRIPKGVLLYGEPGVGKTLMAKSIAGDDIHCVELCSADCAKSNSEKFVLEAFEKARQAAPAVLLIDEIDKIAESGPDLYIASNDKIMKVLLQELDGQKDNSGVLIVATCNHYKQINPALLRAGRFDRVIQVPAPCVEDRKEIIKMYFDKIRITKKIIPSYLAKITAGYTGAQLECIINEAAILALESSDKLMMMEHIQTAMNRMAFSALEGDAGDAEKRRKVAIHEAGHALVAMILAPDKLTNATIIPQGDARGYIRMMRGEREDIESIEETENQIKIALAGTIAEREILGKRYNSSVDDFVKACRMSDYLICNIGAYGYEYLTPLTRIRDDSISEKKKIAVEEKRMELLNWFDELVTETIKSNRKLFDKIADNLTDKFALTKEEMFALQNECLTD